MLTVWNNKKADYFPLLKEGSVYIISNFKVFSNTKEYRVVDGELALNFYHNTHVLPVEDTDSIPHFKFNLTKFEDVRSLLWAKKKFIGTLLHNNLCTSNFYIYVSMHLSARIFRMNAEIIGMVKNFGRLNTASNGAKKLEILLVDNRSAIFLKQNC